ncbi:universal stress protein A [Escherichia coli]|uniref:Universal stress protein A n=1 Tax=Escherichia coli TaxID=562 RepID=A0A2X1PRM3_ECOLX|nr:universal stress protein A [Escherichia coli]
MAYKHILIAVDLSPESKVLVEKAVSMARPYNAKVSLIHVDVNYSDLYTGLIDVIWVICRNASLKRHIMH